MQKIYLLFISTVLFLGCKSETANITPQVLGTGERIEVNYAEGFEIEAFKDFKIITINTPWPNAKETFRYALVQKDAQVTIGEGFDAVIEIPIDSIVVTSTTHIPSLEMLEEGNALVGFPNMNYISSEATRKRITEGKITELGMNENLNTEVLIDLAPDVVVGFAVDGSNTTFDILKKTGIPVLYNADWTETSPLGKAEWIKFFGALFNKSEKAAELFNTIEKDYNEAKTIAESSQTRPTVLSGAMYKDVWYLPQGDSWAAQFIDDANGSYLWKESKGTGSLSLNLESVLEKGKTADFWIGPGQFTGLEPLGEAHSVYRQFDAYKNDNVYSFTTKKGATGGVVYYELAPNRPDLVLKDMIKILHPKLLPNYELYFFSKLK
ncbi:ABC transporter substrate-binding protein [Cochleicola gelatinilyticus]|uniref:ABC transporter substrate-binding protein n=1 Tax=Cochleicola gelatinilyticus TaxID=1763537 RepID=A0A167H3N7_9FLAO|nr:ABC transporter substrate-binding protein [Cochleicola gelatinilyticus]OAB78183.1 ABC transporter substrate-binding protein [Cochleicola gelatinilyticus]